MKPFLGIDLTNDKNNEECNGAEFLVMKTSQELADALERSADEALDIYDKAKLPLPFRIIRVVCGIAALFIVGGIVEADVSFSEGYANAPWLFWCGGICVVVFALLSFWKKMKRREVLKTDESTNTISSYEKATEAIYTELGVPSDARKVDVLSFFYKDKDGKIEVKDSFKQSAPYFNIEYKVYADDNNLYLADTEGKYAFSLSSVKSIRKVKKSIRMFKWNKEEGYDTGIYKQYKLSSDQFGGIHCGSYYVMEVYGDFDVFGVYIPCYELPVFEKLTGMKAQEE